MSIEINSVTKVTDNKWLNLYNVEYTHKGKKGIWTFASRKNNLKLMELRAHSRNPLIADAVVIIPLLTDSQNDKLTTGLVLTKEFRIPIGDYEYGFPAGLYDGVETAEEVARRELKEETGFDLTKILYIGPPSISSAGLSDESVVYVVCECTGKISKEGNQEAEDITTEVFDLDGIKNLLAQNIKISAKALTFLLMFMGMNKIAWPNHIRNVQ